MGIISNLIIGKVIFRLICTQLTKNSALKRLNVLKPIFVVGFIVVLTVLLGFGQKIKAQSSKMISVTIIDSGLELKIKTSQNKVENILNEAKIKVGNQDLIFPYPSSEINQNYKILIYRSTKSVQELKATFQTYTVQPGDTVSKIAKKFGTNWNTIKQANDLKSVDELSIGEKIIIPNEKITETPKVEVVPPKTQTKVESKPVPPAPSKTKTKQVSSEKSLVGMASWYDWKKGMGCACLKFPKGTRLKVTNLQTGVSVEVTVNDSGPYTSKIIDLTREAFSKIANTRSGVVKVKIEKIK